MKITQIHTNKKQYLPLLLLGDEQESMIDRYLARGALFVLEDDGVKSVCVVTHESPGVCELKNLATAPQWQGRGYASALIAYVSAHFKGQYATMLVGTGEVPKTLRFYQKNGFTISHRVLDFFTDHYDHPIIEDGIQLVDMVYLQKAL